MPFHKKEPLPLKLNVLTPFDCPVSAARHGSTCVGEEVAAMGGQARSSGFNAVRSKFMAAKPSLLAPLLPPGTPLGGVHDQSSTNAQ